LFRPEDSAEIRRVTLTNTSRRPRRVELTSYAEIAIFPHAADRAHPAFAKLFVQTEAVPERHSLWLAPLALAQRYAGVGLSLISERNRNHTGRF
jgi:hypothetical protein